MIKTYINYNDKRWKKIRLNIHDVVRATVSDVYSDSEVSIVLTNDEEIRGVNRCYRGVDRATNVLSFELGDPVLMGDIYISFDTVLREARKNNISVSEHFAHMVVHGMLHLQGYDHIDDDDAIVMQEKEVSILKKLSFCDPYTEHKSLFSKYDFVLYALFGCVASVGFAPLDLWFVSVIGFIGAYILTVKKQDVFSVTERVLRIMPFGFFYGIGMFWWVVHSIYVVPELTQQFAVWTIPSLVAIGLVGACFFTAPLLVLMCVRHKLPYRAILCAVSCVVVLWLREWLFTGFPWNPFGVIAQFNGVVINSMALWGALGLTFVLVGMLASFVDMILDVNTKYIRLVFYVFCSLFVVGCVYGRYNIQKANINSNKSPVIRIVQPAMSAVQKASHSNEQMIQHAKFNLQNLYDLAMSSTLKPDLIIFPETAYPFTVTDMFVPLAADLNNNIVMGAMSFTKGDLYNSMIIANSDGNIEEVYNKTHLVPFGEYRPFGDMIPTPGILSKGNGPKIITIKINNKDFSFIPAICYEIIFSDSLTNRPFGTESAIINITNDTWFGKTPGVYQHLNMVKRYAIESGLPIVRANYSGISAFVLSDGTILSSLGVNQTGVLDGSVWGAHNTVYRTIGLNGWFSVILVFSLLVVISIYGLQKRD